MVETFTMNDVFLVDWDFLGGTCSKYKKIKLTFS